VKLFFQISDWKKEKEEMSPGRNVVALNKEELLNVDPTKTDFLLGKWRQSLNHFNTYVFICLRLVMPCPFLV